MTDLELTKLCAEAMKLTIAAWYEGNQPYVEVLEGPRPLNRFDPLHDNAQAMALEDWLIEQDVYISQSLSGFYARGAFGTFSVDLLGSNLKELRRRAICECVAKRQVLIQLEGSDRGG